MSKFFKKIGRGFRKLGRGLNKFFKSKIGRIRDIQVHPSNGKIYFLSQDALWLMQRK